VGWEKVSCCRERTVFYSNRDRYRFRQTGTGTGSTLDRKSVL